MNVLELREFLTHYPDDMEIVNDRYSDYTIIQKEDWSIVWGVEKQGWVMQSHSTMSKENKLAEKAYLRLLGN